MLRNRGQALKQQGRRMLQIIEVGIYHSTLLLRQQMLLSSGAKQHYLHMPPLAPLVHSM